MALLAEPIESLVGNLPLMFRVALENAKEKR